MFNKKKEKVIKTNEEILKEMIEGCFTVEVNLNDTFYYACADGEEVCADDFLDLLPFCKEYGTYKTIHAYCALKRELLGNEKDLVPIWIERGSRQDKKEYNKVKELILESIRKDEDSFIELSFELEEKEKELEEFGENISWTSAQQKTGLVLQVASLLNKKIYGIGSCRRDAIDDLKLKLKEMENGSN